MAAAGQQGWCCGRRSCWPPHDGAESKDIVLALGCLPSLVQRVWKDSGLAPHRVKYDKSFKASNDPKLAEKLVDIVGLSLNPPEHGLMILGSERPVWASTLYSGLPARRKNAR